MKNKRGASKERALVSQAGRAWDARKERTSRKVLLLSGRGVGFLFVQEKPVLRAGSEVTGSAGTINKA